jgi:hypothetical protein
MSAVGCKDDLQKWIKRIDTCGLGIGASDFGYVRFSSNTDSHGATGKAANVFGT